MRCGGNHMLKTELDTKVQFLHGFGHKTRVQILDTLKTGEKTVSEIISTINGSQSSISQHLACLRGCGIIIGRQDGKYMYYRLRNDKIHQLLETFEDILLDIENDVMSCNHHID